MSLFLICYCKLHHYHQNVKIAELLETNLYALVFEQTYHHIVLLFANNVYMKALKQDPYDKLH